MAHWISSKLKAAETLLHQIDQQAAESLGKNDNPQFHLNAQLDLPKTSETKPLIKDQLKKKAPDINPPIITNYVKRNNNNGDDDEVNSLDNKNATKGLTDSDWTELLSVPDKRGGPKINDNKVRTSTSTRSGLNLSKGRNNGALKTWRKSNVELANNTNVDIEEKPTSSGNATPRISSVQSTSSGGELDQGYNVQTLVVGENDNIEKVEVNDTGGSEKSLDVLPVSHQRKLGRTKSGNGSNGSKMKKVASLASDGDSNSDIDTSSSSGSESEREREERRKRRQQILAEKAAAKAVEAIKERENLVAKLEGEKQSLEKILEERAKQHVKEASELQTTMMETMEAVELEKQKHNNTRMEALSRLAKLESSNADLARSLANAQKNLEIEVNRVAELRQQIHSKEATAEELLRREISITLQHGDKSLASRGVEFELDMLKADYSFLTDKVGRMQEKIKTLETSIEITRQQVENPTQVEIELKRRLGQLTDHLIQKQAQVETLSSEKATLHFRIEAVSRMIDENKSMTEFADFPENMSTHNSKSGVWQISESNLKLIKQRMHSGQQHLGSLVRQLDSLYCTGAVFLRRNSTAKIWSLLYLVCLHLWVMYILMSHSPVSDDNRSGAAVSLENINNTGGSI